MWLRGLHTGLAGTAQHEHQQMRRETCRGGSVRPGAHWREVSGGAIPPSDGGFQTSNEEQLGAREGETASRPPHGSPSVGEPPGQADLLPGSDTDLDITFFQGFSGAPSPATCTLFLPALAGGGPGGPQGGGCWGPRPCLHLCSRVGHP